MIISHKNKFIFIRPYKVAGTSLEYAMTPFLGRDDIVCELGKDEEKKRTMEFGLGERNNKKTLEDMLRDFTKRDRSRILKFRWPEKFDGHCNAEFISKKLGSDIWSEYKKISVVRNPWTYLVSFYYWNPSKEKRLPFPQWCRENKHLINANRQHYFVNKKYIIDYLIRFEDFPSDLRTLEQKIPGLMGLSNVFSGANFKTGYSPKDLSVSKMFEGEDWLKSAILQQANFEIKKLSYSMPK